MKKNISFVMSGICAISTAGAATERIGFGSTNVTNQSIGRDALHSVFGGH